MAVFHLIKFLSVLIILQLSYSSFAESECQEVIVKNKRAKAVEKIDLCFLPDKSYFISRNCKNLDCKFIHKLKVSNLPHSLKNRPGTTACRFLGGGVETVEIVSIKDSIPRCIFKDEHSSISLNLLESWNGKSFSGPAPSIDF